MKQIFKFSILLILLGFIFFGSSCEGNLEVDCELYDVDITIAIDSTGAILAANVTEGTPEYNYIWSTGEITSSIVVDEEGSYSVTVTDSNECSDEATREVVFQTDCLGFTAGIAGSDTLLVAFGQGGTEPYAYNWSEGSTTQEIMVMGSGVYTVTITDAEGCDDVASYDVSLDPCADLQANINILTDSTNNSTILVGYATGGTAAYTYEWSNGATTAEIQPNAFGIYTLIVTDAAGCTSETSVNYQDSGNPCDGFFAEIVAEEDPAIPGNYILSVNTSGGFVINQYIWSTNEFTPTISVQPPGTWTVVLGSESGCDAIATIML